MVFISCKAEQPLNGIELQEKENENNEIIIEMLFRKILKRKRTRLDFNVILIIGQRKTFYHERILELSCARKETAGLDVS